jgi:hypothetical protein
VAELAANIVDDRFLIKQKIPCEPLPAKQNDFAGIRYNFQALSAMPFSYQRSAISFHRATGLGPSTRIRLSAAAGI